MSEAFAERGVAARVLGPPSMPTFLFADPAVEDAFYAEAARAGVLFFQDDAQCPRRCTARSSRRPCSSSSPPSPRSRADRASSVTRPSSATPSAA
ncbi:MAG: hypothetical protein M5U28_23835 [Sandaracinaceae bacterium]|nr:hypothetical protein [Sandaracinaceae bacterium]